MDPAGLLICVGSVLESLDHVSETYNPDPGTFSLIRSQLKILEAGIQRIQEFLHFTDPTSRAQITSSLTESISTVTSCAGRLQEDLASITRARPTEFDSAVPNGTASDDPAERPKFTYNESRMRKNLTDVRECVSLIHFTFSVCQLPVGQGAEREIQELTTSAKALNRAQSSARRERQSVLRDQQSLRGQHQSEELRNFLSSVLDAEEELSDISTPDGLLSQRSSWTSSLLDTNTLGTNTLPRGDPDELHFPGIKVNGESPVEQRLVPQYSRNGSVSERIRSWTRPRQSSAPYPITPSEPFAQSSRFRAFSSGGDDRFGSRSGPGAPERPPKLPERPRAHTTFPLGSSKSISRKPVGRASLSESSSIPRATSVYTSMDNGMLTPTPPSALTTTSMLFTQASRSLTDLAENMTITNEHQETESPPPYVDEPSPAPRLGDIKRQDTEPELEIIGDTPNTFQLVQENRLDVLRQFLRQGVGIDEMDPATKRTVIMEAASLRRNSASQMLVNAGSRLHLKDAEGNTALHFAALQGDADICRILLEAGAQVDEYNKAGDTPLVVAARGGHIDAVLCLLNSWTTQKAAGITLMKGFLEAVKSGSVPTATAFVERGVQPRKIDDAWAPACNAATSGSIPMLDFVLSHKCSLKKKSPAGWTPLHFAAFHGHTAMVEKLLALKLSWKAQTKKSEETPLHLAINARHTSTAMALIIFKERQEVITMKDADHQQPIHHAVRNGDISMTSALLVRGAKLDDQTGYGFSPMLLAAAYGHLPLVAEFITRGVSIEEKLGSPSFKPQKRTNEAARKGYWAEIRWPHPGARPLHLALEFGHDDVANILIAGGAKIEESDSKGWRPLHYAAFNCRPAMVDLLLVRGASPHATTSEGNTPLSLGFRGPGMLAPTEEKQHIHDVLQAAMYAHKKSKFKQFSDFMTTGKKSRDAAERNRTWHTAELAAILYQNSEEVEEEEEDDETPLTPSVNSQNKKGDDEDYNDTAFGHGSVPPGIDRAWSG